jgi:Domain of unknown function (DUF4190)
VPHLDPVSGAPHAAPTSGAADRTAPTSAADRTAPTSGAAVAAGPGPTATARPNAFASAPTASAPYPNQTYAWSYPPVAGRLNNTALASMIVSLASFVTCPLLGLLGVYLGTRARGEIKARNEEGDGMAIAGIVAGWIATGLTVLLMIVYAMVAGFVLSMAARSGG